MVSNTAMPDPRRVAYFSMEIFLDERLPTYAGGLGVLAGDMLRACADLRVPVVAVTMLYRKGYFRQRLRSDGGQEESADDDWQPGSMLQRLPESVQVTIEGRTVRVDAWRFDVVGRGGFVVPVLLLDTGHPENQPNDRALSDSLYGDGDSYRLAQEIVLGIGGVRMLRALGFSQLQTFHLNEGHAALAGIELMREDWSRTGVWDPREVRRRCVFTTHTPVPAGHDQFDLGLVGRMLREPVPASVLAALAGSERLNMTLLALNLSHYINGVARAHELVAEHMFPGRDFAHVTNGVHSATWTAESFQRLYDRRLPDWRDDPAMLRHALAIPADEIWAAHQEAKLQLLATVKDRRQRTLDPHVLTVGFARRSTAYKRADLLFRDLERLRALGRGRLQLVYAGKAHPRDGDGKQLIQRVFAAGAALGGDVPVVYLEDYGVGLARQLVAGVDLWLNTPLRPLEASGTSGMKAAHNGVPSLSVLDGWWNEGCVEGVTGWAIGGKYDAGMGPAVADREDAEDLYRKLEQQVLPTFYGDRPRWVGLMQHAIALNASYFNAHRMVQQYVTNAYLD
jgi:glycogen phosphorylase